MDKTPESYVITVNPEISCWLTAKTGTDRLGGDTDAHYGLEDAGWGKVRIPAAALPRLMDRAWEEDGVVGGDGGGGNYTIWIGGLTYPLTPEVTEVQDAVVIDPENAYPTPGSKIPGQPGYVVGTCGHRVAGSEWRAGFRTCERCPSDTD